MTIAIVVDSACDLPSETLAAANITLASVNIRINGLTFPDKRDSERMQKVYRERRLELPNEAATTPPSVDDFARLFTKLAQKDYDEIYVITLMTSRSNTYHNAEEAAQSLRNQLRTQAKKLVHIHVLDSASMFAGQGAVVLHLLRILGLRGGETVHIDPIAVSARFEYIQRCTENYLVLREPVYMRKRARLRNDQSITWYRELLHKLRRRYPIILNQYGSTQVIDQQAGYSNAMNAVIQKCLAAVRDDCIYNGVVVVSVADDVTWLRQLDSYVRFKEACSAYNVELHETVMSLSGGVYLGPGAFSLAFTRKSKLKKLAP